MDIDTLRGKYNKILCQSRFFGLNARVGIAESSQVRHVIVLGLRDPPQGVVGPSLGGIGGPRSPEEPNLAWHFTEPGEKWSAETAELPLARYADDRALTRTRSFEEAAAALGARAVVAVGPDLFNELLDDGAKFIRRQQSETAAPLLNLALEATASLARNDIDVPPSYAFELSRRLAQVDQLRGHFASAEEQLRDLLDQEDDDLRALIQADLGMVQCHIRSLADVRLPEDPRDWADVVKMLEPGEEMLQAARTGGTSRRAHAEYCLGVLELARERSDVARVHFECAVAEMSANRSLFAPIGTLPRAKLYLAICLAEGGEIGRLEECRARILDAASGLPENEGAHGLGRALEYLCIFAPHEAAEVAIALHNEHGRDVLDVSVQSGVLRRAPALLRALASRAAESGRSTSKRFEDWTHVLRESLLCSPPERELAERALDKLEDLAGDATRRRSFLKILSTSSGYSPAWDDDDALFARVRLHEAAGSCSRAAVLLVEHGHHALTTDKARGIAVAEGLLERISGYGLSDVDESLALRVHAMRTEERERTDGIETQVETRGSIVFVGGDETQERARDWLMEQVAARWPGVTLSVRCPGWSANWRARLDSFENEIRDCDVVVLSRYVRTNMGRTIRKLCGEISRPWVPCTGTGRETMLASIELGVALLSGS